MKLSISLSDFQAHTDLEAKQNGNLLYVALPKLGKIELNLTRSEWVVGSGSKFYVEIKNAVRNAGFEMTKEATNWTYFTYKNLNELQTLIDIIQPLAPTSTKKVKVAKVKVEKASKKPMLSDDDIAEIRAKNMEVIKNVGSRVRQHVIPEHDEVTQKFMEEADEYARSQGPDFFLRHLGLR